MNTVALDQAINTLDEHKDEWATLPIAAKMALLMQVRERLAKACERWVEASVKGKQIDPKSPWVGEEWVSGPWALAGGINGLLETLHTLSEGHPPKLKKVTTRPNGQVVAEVFPNNIFETLLLNGVTAEVWMEPGVTKETLSHQMAAFYKQENPKGKVALVLGAGNINSIAPLHSLISLKNIWHAA